MIHPKHALHGATSDLTPRTFMRAAGLANLIVGTMVFAEFGVMSLVRHDPRAFVFGLVFVPIVTLVIWVTAAVLYVLALVPRGLRALGRRLVGRSRSPLSAGSGVWDDWLDNPEPHDR